MNAISLRALERITLEQHEKRLSGMRGKDLPVVKHDFSLPSLREERARQTAERKERVAQLRRLGLSAEEISAQTGLTLRQIGYVERLARKAER